MSTFKETEEVHKLLIESGNEQLCKRTILFVEHICKEEGILLAEHQRLSLISHLSAMVRRSHNGIEIEAVDKEMFNQISEYSVNISRKIVDFLPNLKEDEAYLLSIHFESAR